MKHLLFTSMLFAACAANNVTLGELAQDVESDNGESMNGESMNGESMNGESMNGDLGTFTLWTSLTNVALNGVALDSVTLSQTLFSGERGLETFSGADFVGAEFDGMRDRGLLVRMKITGMIQVGTRAAYFVSYQVGEEWVPICTDALNSPVEAYPLNGTWDHRQGVEGGGSWSADTERFTFACRRLGAIAKCVDLGYEPWVTQDHHLACIRMLRADYCRNGKPYTTNGRRINLYDSLDIQVDTNEWYLDGEWDAGGARCFTSHNRASGPTDCPVTPEGCGDLQHFGSGTLIMNEIP